MIYPDVAHPDDSYGLANLGTLNICLLFPCLLAFVNVFGVVITHHRAYVSVVLPLCTLTILFLIVSYVTIMPILSQARKTQREFYNKLIIGARHRQDMSQKESILFAIERICFSLSNTSPYSRNGRAILFAMRAIPVASTMIKAYLG